MNGAPLSDQRFNNHGQLNCDPLDRLTFRAVESGKRDLLAPLLELRDVADAAAAAREALGRAHRHRTNLRNWPRTAAE